ncbi:acyltransferase family protein [Paucibacter sp. XJ19-41]|uniref:acyltransferase family protein n=1 Tax=Paucibacter sp. XJ19-41 TaxID=2927824 RepID=UPI0023493D3E|nr:acyltransferase [Paucibacter sp. XJ19-41]MDC6166638.1 acyltransferase [Paucibacter sp. XJ19-41]
MTKDRGRDFEWIEILRYPLMVGVVLVHAYDPVNRYGGGLSSLQGRSEVSDAVMYFISQVVSRLSVPAFFVFAGYFFVRASYGCGFHGWIAQVRKRVRTLVLPFLFWGLMVLIVFYLGQQTGVVPIGPQSRVGEISSLPWTSLVDLWVGVTRSPIAYQFWFMRDLILCVFLSLPLVFLSEAVYFLFILILGVAWFFGVSIVDIPSMAAVFFFCLGGYISIEGARIRFGDAGWVMLLATLALMVMDLAFRYSAWNDYIHRLFLLLGVMSLYSASNWILQFKRPSKWLLRQAPTGFLLFALHEPALLALKKFFFGIWGSAPEPWMILLTYSFPVLVILIGVDLAYRLLSQRAPRLLAFVTGGRT